VSGRQTRNPGSNGKKLLQGVERKGKKKILKKKGIRCNEEGGSGRTSPVTTSKAKSRVRSFHGISFRDDLEKDL